jgi:hypothetical protein
MNKYLAFIIFGMALLVLSCWVGAYFIHLVGWDSWASFPIFFTGGIVFLCGAGMFAYGAASLESSK